MNIIGSSMKTELKRQALKLRLEDKLSLSEISKATGLSKSTLSIHLRDYPLDNARLLELNIAGQMKGSETNKHLAKNRKLQYNQIGSELIESSIMFRDLCMLYWGEGTKFNGNSRFSICNSDYNMIIYIIKILLNLINANKLVITCYYHNADDELPIKLYWETKLKLPIKMYKIKNSKRSLEKRINKQPNGTIRIDVNDKKMLDMVLGGIDKIKNGSLIQR